MPLQPGTQLGPYEILAPLGAGGMGEVHKARDTRLDRTVAIKVLPEHVASDPDFKQRFEREAKTISSLNHPHICTLYDIGSQDGIDFLVMEYLEGDTLAQRLTKGALALDQALQVAIQIADALDKAHRQGITHRDLKPGNIMLTKAGAKLLDFGLAKLRPPGTVGADGFSAATTQDEPLTGWGTILGTLQYMAPEQVEGKEADHRTDIFAFGAVVYEMATGQKAFSGGSQASLIAAILEREPVPMSTLQQMTPARLDEIVKTCLAKDPDERWQSAGDVGRQVKGIIEGRSQTSVSVPGAGAPHRARWRQALPWVAGILFATMTSLGVWNLTRPDAPRVARFPLAALSRADASGVPSVAVSPDGTRVVYVSAGGQFYVRQLDTLEAVPLRGAVGINPFFSPDGNSVGFRGPGLTDDNLYRVALDGGPRVTLTERIGGIHGASWGPNDTIVFASTAPAPLFRLSAAGGERQALTELAEGELAHKWPEFLPGGEAVLFNVVKGERIVSGEMEIWVLDLTSNQRTLLLTGGANPRYVRTGHVVYGENGTLFAVPFDLDRLVVTGDSMPVLEGVATARSGAVHFSVSQDGSLVYVTGDTDEVGTRSLVWVDREGREEPISAEPRPYSQAQLSPDGRQVVLQLDSPTGSSDIWIYDLMRDAPTQLTFDPARDTSPIWTPDGERVVFTSEREGVPAIFWKPADGTGQVERLTPGNVLGQSAHSWSADGRALVIVELDGETLRDIGVLSMNGDQAIDWLLEGNASEQSPDVSPNGRWLAYMTAESGQFEVFVSPFPSVSEGRWKVSQAGGFSPRWGPDSRELFYQTGDGAIMVATNVTEPTFAPGIPVRLLDGPYVVGERRRTFDLSPDGQRLLMLKESAGADAPSNQSQVILIQNWFDELQRLVPTP